jgi:fatty acid hydroxylase domain-containing protein 2
VVYGTTIYAFLVYWLLGSFFMIFDVTNKPAFIRRYKVQPGTNEPVDPGLLYQVIKQVLFNQIVVGLPLAMNGFKTAELRGIPDIRTLPMFYQLVVDLSVCYILREITFYYSHRLLHHPLLYKYIHKRHHEWTAPIAVAAAYCHPIEHVLSNILPVVIGPLVMGSHLVTMWIWIFWLTSETLATHSGYHLPFVPYSPEAHDFHHLK